MRARVNFQIGMMPILRNYAGFSCANEFLAVDLFVEIIRELRKPVGVRCKVKRRLMTLSNLGDML